MYTDKHYKSICLTSSISPSGGALYFLHGKSDEAPLLREVSDETGIHCGKFKSWFTVFHEENRGRHRTVNQSHVIWPKPLYVVNIHRYIFVPKGIKIILLLSENGTQ